MPMFIALRRFTLLFTILLERYWLKKSHDWPTLSAMGIMIGGKHGCHSCCCRMLFLPRSQRRVQFSVCGRGASSRSASLFC